MGKKILSLVLGWILLLSAVLPVFAEEQETPKSRTVSIINFKNLERLAEDCRLDSYSRDLVVSLKADLDLTDSDFAGIPIFCGRFEGNGHTIRGLNLTGEGSVQGFFRYLTDSAVVNELHLEGSVQPTGSAVTVGGFAGKNSGILQDCSFTGTVSGKEYIGGVAGENSVSGLIENCSVNGTVYGGHFVGGIAGKNAGTIRGCENRGSINETARQNKVELTDINLNAVIHSESANTVTDVGGIAGNNTGVIRSCVNYGVVGHRSMGYNIGGIAGTQSGSVLSCENMGEISGRKEVGGIVGQMEPSSVMEFHEDALQILSRQLDSMGKVVSAATSNLQGAGEKILRQMAGMAGYIGDAQEAIQTLIPDPEKMEFPDLDTIQAARNNIGSSLSGMTNLMKGVSATAYGAMGKVSTNLHAINDQIEAMRNTIGNFSETTGGSIIDRSDEDTELDFSGKVADCRNYGNVQADLNCGGIAGAISMENDLDMEEDWLISGENSLNFESELRAVVLNCENSGVIAAGKQHAGGIAGFQSLGLVKSSRNSGRVDGGKADYVGGISGRSMGFIRSCYAKGEISGGSCVGGIAGAAAIATDCCTLVQITGGAEKLGAVLGFTEENRTEVKNPISGNYYLTVQKDPGGIDGISYDGQAQPLQKEGFFLLENLPEMFRYATVSFRYGNGAERNFKVDYGSSFPEAWIPPIPPQDGKQSYWSGMDEADLSEICFDLVFEQACTSQTTVLQSTDSRNGLPLLLVQGIFPENTGLSVQQADTQISLENGETLLDHWQFRTTEPAGQTQLRLQLPEGTDEKNIRTLIRGADGLWRTEAHHVLGRYAVVPLITGDDAVAVIQTESTSWLMYGFAAAALAVLTGILISRHRKKHV